MAEPANPMQDAGRWVRFALSLNEGNPHIVAGPDLAAFLTEQAKTIDALRAENADLRALAQEAEEDADG